MKYISTRGGDAPQSFADILLGGLAADGGLYLPQRYPEVTAAELDAWRSLDYAELALRILEKFIDDIARDDLQRLLQRTYTAQTFRHCRPGRNAADIAPITSLAPEFHLLELSNGPTLAFKDMAMQLLGALFEHVLTQRGERINILGATSGDTGSAAEYAMRGKRGVRVFMLSPHGRMSDFQRAQMYSLDDDNIINIAVRGMFDDCQDIVKAVAADAAFKSRYRIGAVNSINWARVLAQVVYYFKGYFAVSRSSDDAVAFAVPTGNFGNICAGHIARQMGLPISRLILATNENDVLDEFFRSGVYRPRSVADTHVTSSPSMDISKASNFERFIFDLVGRDAAVVRDLWRQVDVDGGFDLGAAPGRNGGADYGFVSGSSTHADRIEVIGDVWRRHRVMIDPHTADAVKVARQQQQPGEHMVVLETAQAAKFAVTIEEALGMRPPRPAELEGLEQAPQHVVVTDADVAAIKQLVARRCDA